MLCFLYEVVRGRARCARQQQDGSVRLPEALVPYVGKETLHPVR